MDTATDILENEMWVSHAMSAKPNFNLELLYGDLFSNRFLSNSPQIAFHVLLQQILPAIVLPDIKRAIRCDHRHLLPEGAL